jgi:hypothetical protein
VAVIPLIQPALEFTLGLTLGFKQRIQPGLKIVVDLPLGLCGLPLGLGEVTLRFGDRACHDNQSFLHPLQTVDVLRVLNV